jgi:long-chain fatty acid transport protein
MRTLCAVLLPTMILGACQTTLAGGLLLYETGTPEVGLAAAGWAARAQDAATVGTNPAGMTRLAGDEVLIGSQLLYGDVEFSADGGSTAGGGDGGNPIGLFPGLSTYYSHSASDRLKFGLALYGNLGLALDYDKGWVGRYHVQDGTFIGLTVAPTMAYRLTDKLSVGGGLNLMYGLFEAKVAINNLTPGLADGELEVQDSQWGYGANLGVLYELSETTRFGLQYTSPIELDFKDTVDFTGLGPGLTAALQVTGNLNPELSLDMTVPQTVMASFFHQIDGQWALLGNLGWQDWSAYGRVGLRLDAASSTSLTKDRDYDDSFHAALGVQYALASPWLLSCGVAFDSGIVDKETRTPDLPNGDSWRLALGGRYRFSRNLDLGLGYSLLWMGDLAVQQSGGPLSGSLSGTYEESAIHFFALNLRWAF